MILICMYNRQSTIIKTLCTEVHDMNIQFDLFQYTTVVIIIALCSTVRAF